jgi:hypothetical protein
MLLPEVTLDTFQQFAHQHSLELARCSRWQYLLVTLERLVAFADGVRSVTATDYSLSLVDQHSALLDDQTHLVLPLTQRFRSQLG